jgi:hypothetical protein
MKRSGRDEPMWVVIHVHGDNTKNVSIAIFISNIKTTMFFLLSHVFSSTKLENKRMEQITTQRIKKKKEERMIFFILESH